MKDKILVFASVPPPKHGQSIMVSSFIDFLKSKDDVITTYHIDARFSESMNELGAMKIRKVGLLISYLWNMVAHRCRFGVRKLYYVPAPAKINAMGRDWFVLLVGRMLFDTIYLHWHAVGLGEWTESNKSGKKSVVSFFNRFIYSHPYVNIVLTQWGRNDLRVFNQADIRIVPNGIVDPCGDMAHDVMAKRLDRFQQIRDCLQTKDPICYNVLYIGHCSFEKGLYDAAKSVAIANQRLASNGESIKVKLLVAGPFDSENDSQSFQNYIQQLHDEYNIDEDSIEVRGFVDGVAKRNVFMWADCLCFPTKYIAESFGLVIIEALAYGITPVVSNWRMLPEIMGSIGLPVAEVGNPDSIANSIISSIGRDNPMWLRKLFLEKYTKDINNNEMLSIITS